MNWKKRDSSNTIEEVIERNTGLSSNELITPKPHYHIQNLDKAAQLILNAIQNKKPIHIYGDYDADGVTSCSILSMALEHLNCDNFSTYLPCRFLDGYGLSERAIETINDGLLITVDNGISAVDAIANAKKKGIEVLILDHHLPREDGVLPNADVIVDPNALPDSDFNSYCAAGLAYRLAKELIDATNTVFLERLSCLAAIGTVADVMPLIHDNRKIVIEGLNAMNKGIMPTGLKALTEFLGMYYFEADDFGFKLGPIINAVGRLKEHGAQIAFDLMCSEDFDNAEVLSKHLIEINEERKEAVTEGVSCCELKIAEECLYGECPLVIYTSKDEPYQFPEGIVGILAGRIAENYKVPTIVLTETEKGYKGSGRSYGGVNLKEVLDKVNKHLVAYGGHSGAAGLTVKKENIEDFRFDMQGLCNNNITDDPDCCIYDLEIESNQVLSMLKSLKKFAPYGEGNPKPVFKIKRVVMVPKAGAFVKRMGSEGQHIKMFGPNYDVVAFDGSAKYEDFGNPIAIDVLGCISENHFGGREDIQVEALDFTRNEKENKSELADLLSAHLKNKGFK